MPRSKVKTGHVRQIIWKNIQYSTSNITTVEQQISPVVVNRFVHESAVTIWFLSASATYSFRVISGENSAHPNSLWRKKKKKERKKEKNSDRPIPRKLFRRLPFLNAIHSVNKKEERLDTMVAGYYLLANYTWARSGGEFPSRLQ